MSREHIPITDKTPGSQRVHVDLNERLRRPVYEPIPQDELRTRRAESKRKTNPVKSTLLGALSVGAALVVLHTAFAKDEKVEKIKLDNTEDIRKGVEKTNQEKQFFNTVVNEDGKIVVIPNFDEAQRTPEVSIDEGGVQYNPAEEGVYQDPTKTPSP